MVLTFAGASVPLFRWFLFCFERVIHSRSRSYYLFFNYLFFNYLYGGSLYAENLGGGGFTICGECGGGGVHYMRGKLARITAICG